MVVVDSDLDSDEGEVQSGAGLDFLPLDPVPGSTRGRKRRREAQGGTQEPDAPVWRGAGQNEFTSLPQHSSLLRLHEEVLEFVSMMRPTAAEEEAANVTLLRVVSVVKHGWPDAEITLFGSRASGMALPEADWDICLNGVPCTQSALSQLGYVRSRPLGCAHGGPLGLVCVSGVKLHPFPASTTGPAAIWPRSRGGSDRKGTCSHRQVL